MIQKMSDGVGLYYETKGEGQPIIFIGGWRMSTPWWQKQFDFFSSFSNAFFLDMRGYGKSEKTDKGHRMGRHGKDIHDFIHADDLDQVTLVGWSQGSSDIWSYIDLYGVARLKSVVFVDQTPKLLSDDDWRFGLGDSFDLNELADFVGTAAQDDRGFVEGFIPTMFTPENANKLSDNEKSWMADEMLKLPTKNALELIIDHCVQDWRNVLPKITVPALYIGGEMSPYAKRGAADYVVKNIPNAQLKIFEKSAHCPFYEEAELFNMTVKDFVESVGKSS